MSGGSFNYLCDARTLAALATRADDLSDMVTALAELGYAEDAAAETAGVLATLRAAGARVEASTDRLAPVWQAMEWWRSYDRDENGLRQALAEYRGETHTLRTTYQLTATEAEAVDALRRARAKEA